MAERETASTWVGIHGVALKENSGSSIAEGAVDHVRVSSDPANVCHTGKNVSRMVVEYILGVHEAMVHQIHEQTEA